MEPVQAETEHGLQQHGSFLCGTKMLSSPKMAWKVTGVQVELLRLPEEMVRGRGRQSLQLTPFASLGPSGSQQHIC